MLHLLLVFLPATLPADLLLLATLPLLLAAILTPLPLCLSPKVNLKNVTSLTFSSA